MIHFATKGRGQPPARVFYRGPVLIDPARDSGGGPSGLRPEGAQGEAPQSGLSDSEGIAQSTSEAGHDD